MLKEISENNVRKEFYLECFLCQVELLSHTNLERIVRMANEEGWSYDTENDLVLCPECTKIIQKIDSKEEP